jgi:hypothetical protein
MRHLKGGSLLHKVSRNKVVVEIEIGKNKFSSMEIEDGLPNVNFNNPYYKHKIVTLKIHRRTSFCFFSNSTVCRRKYQSKTILNLICTFDV